MKEKMEQMAQDHKQAREDLKQKIKEQMEKGDLAEAAKLQHVCDNFVTKEPALERAVTAV